MNSETLKKITEVFIKQGKMVFLDGATEVQIIAFEKNHDIKLPEGCKPWLRFSEDGIYEDFEIFLNDLYDLLGIGD